MELGFAELKFRKNFEILHHLSYLFRIYSKNHSHLSIFKTKYISQEIAIYLSIENLSWKERQRHFTMIYHKNIDYSAAILLLNLKRCYIAMTTKMSPGDV